MLSFLAHLLLVTGVFTPEPELSSVQIEVVFSRSAGTPQIERKKNTPHKTTLADSKASAVLPSGNSDNSPGPQNGDAGADIATVLGADIGIHAGYPRLSRVMKESGVVVVGIANAQVQLIQGSGYKRLDDSALSATGEALHNGALAELLKSKPNLYVRFIFRIVGTTSESESEKDSVER